LIEECGGKLSGYEFKWKARPGKIPAAFARAYPEVGVKMVTKENYKEFVGL